MNRSLSRYEWPASCEACSMRHIEPVLALGTSRACLTQRQSRYHSSKMETPAPRYPIRSATGKASRLVLTGSMVIGIPSHSRVDQANSSEIGICRNTKFGGNIGWPVKARSDDRMSRDRVSKCNHDQAELAFYPLSYSRSDLNRTELGKGQDRYSTDSPYRTDRIAYRARQ